MLASNLAIRELYLFNLSFGLVCSYRTVFTSHFKAFIVSLFPHFNIDTECPFKALSLEIETRKYAVLRYMIDCAGLMPSVSYYNGYHTVFMNREHVENYYVHYFEIGRL